MHIYAHIFIYTHTLTQITTGAICVVIVIREQIVSEALSCYIVPLSLGNVWIQIFSLR